MNTNYTRKYNSCKTLQQITIHEIITHVKHYNKLQTTKDKPTPYYFEIKHA